MGFFDVRRVKSTLSSADVVVRMDDAQRAALARAPVDALLAITLDTSEPWWRRRACAVALTGRAPAEAMDAIVARIIDTKDTSEVRRALLALAASPEVAPSSALVMWLRAQEGTEQPYGLDEAILEARGRLGDLEAARPLATLAYDPWTHRRRDGEAGIDALITRRGLGDVLDALGARSVHALMTSGARAEERLLGVRLAVTTGVGVAIALCDADVVVAHAAYLALCASEIVDEDALERCVLEGLDAVRGGLDDAYPSGPAGACLWALAVRAARGRDISATYAELGRPRVPIAGVPEDIRLAIIREYAPGHRTTDPRFLLEAACTALPPAPDEDEALARARDALADVGLAPREPISAGHYHNQGGGTFHVIVTDGGHVRLSTLGPFAEVSAAPQHARRALERAGFRCLDADVLDLRFTGLAVYFFGAREPLSVRDLLFYWQD